MNIAKVHVERLNKTGESRLTLRNGQVAFGKVNKIYPNNRAEVQIGSHRFIAQIETPLAVGERYIFEVNKKSDQLIHLKVISTQINEMKQDHIVSLLRQLHINVNQINVSFAQSLLNEKIPFRKNELINALQLLDKFGHSINNQTIMKQMMMNKYPIQESIFQSLLAVKQNNFSESIARVLNVSSSITPSQTLTKLHTLLNNLIQKPSANQLNLLPQGQLRSLVSSLQILNLIHVNESNELINYVTEDTFSRVSTHDSMKSLLNGLQQNMQNRTNYTLSGQLIKQYKPLYHVANQLLHQVNLTKVQRLTNEQFNLLSERIENNLLPLLPDKVQQIVNTLLRVNNQANLTQLNALLQTFTTNQFYSLLAETMVASTKEDSLNHFTTTQQRFLLHVDQIVQTLGFANESIVKNEQVQQGLTPSAFLNIQETIKALLLQVSQDERTPLENIQQLVHYINGLQLQTKEENNLLRANLQIPGKKIGLPDDLLIQFEGRKTKNDEIDAEFCRILFFLQLNHIKDTIIDMNIQKRVITITVYNEFSNTLSKQTEPLTQILDKRLTQLDFHLSNVRFRPIADHDSPSYETRVQQNVSSNNQEGFDVRI